MLPGITVSEELSFVKNVKNEGRTILLLGNTGYEKDTKKLYTFRSKENAIQQLTTPTTKKEESTPTSSASSPTTTTQTETKKDEKRDESAYNAFIKVISDIFGEADANHAIHGIGLTKVYAVNVGKNAKKEDIIAALAAAEKETRIDIELYPTLTDIDVINAVKDHLNEIKTHGDYRIAIATVKEDDVDKMINSVQKQGKSVIDSSRVVLHVDSGMVGFLAAKIACNPYYQDPAKNPYYTTNPKEIKQFSRESLVKLLDAGLVADQIITGMDGARIVETPYIRSTSYKKDNRGGDSYLHQRLNADQHASVTDAIARKYIKNNNTETARHSIELECQSYLNREMTNERLMDYSYNVQPKEDDPYSLMVDMTLKPPKSIYYIQIHRTIQI